MSEFRSKCCGAEIYWESVELDAWKHIDTMYCSKCHKPTEVEEKEEEKEQQKYVDDFQQRRW